MMKVLFINAIDPNSEIQSRFPPLGLGYLVSSLRKHFGDDTFQFKITDQNVRNEMESFKPEIVGITSVSQNYGIAQNYIKDAYILGIPVIMGGVHISTLPASLNKYADLAIIGEGEKTIIDVIKLFMLTGKLHKENLREITGIAFRENNGDVVLTEKREPITFLDEIPLPARDMFKIDRRSYLFSSRGCPYSCIFCASSHFWGKTRFFSAEYVVNEIRELVEKYNVNFVTFYDDLMIADSLRLYRIVELLQDKIFKKVRFSINARANLITEYVAQLLQKMNVVSVGLGLESGNDRVLHYLKGENVSVAQNQKAINILHQYGIAANASFIIGSPDETKEEIMDTYQFIKHSGLNYFDTYVMTPFPGTPIWEDAEKRGVILRNSWEGRLEINFSKNEWPIIISKNFDWGELKKIYSKFQKLRLWIAFKNVWKHPFLKYIIIALAKQIEMNLKAKIREFSFQRMVYATLLVLTFVLTSPFLLIIFATHYIQKWRGVS